MGRLRLLLTVALIGLTGCENGNLFGKLNDSGSSSDSSVLLSDAQIALDNKDFATALTLYERILEQNPSNSLALHGAAIAAMASAGLDFGTILSNIAENSSAAPSINGLSDLISSARLGYVANAASADSILSGLNLEAIDAALDLAICRLTRIVSGSSDGIIRSNDVAVILDLACLRLIRGVLRPIQSGYFDVVNEDGDYDLVILADAAAICGNPANDELVIKAAKDIVAGYVLFARAASVLNVADGTITARIRDELSEVIAEGLDGDTADDLPPDCVNTIDGAGINAGNFQSNTEAFDPQSGC